MVGPTPRDFEITELAGRLRLASARLHRRLRQEADAGLSPSQQSALGTIDARGPLTLGDLAAAEHVTPPTITKVIARLEEEGLVHRTVDASDRRVTRVSATREGRRRLEHSRARRNAFLAVRLRELGPDAVRRLHDAIDALEELAGVGART
ncbi:MAG: MarR family winged helix-turn-helix transcriptional regulator [Acidimicrobiales bacterium]